METLEQQFNSAASGAIAHLRGREQALAGFGWTGRRAEWIALACLHGGVFTRAQWTSFLGCHHEKVRRAVRALVAQGVAVEENPPGIDGIGRVCRIHGRGIYRALGAGDFRRRRITSREVLMRRLLSLDYVLEHPHLPWLSIEPEKVAAFEALGIERRILPRRIYRELTCPKCLGHFVTHGIGADKRLLEPAERSVAGSNNVASGAGGR